MHCVNDYFLQNPVDTKLSFKSSCCQVNHCIFFYLLLEMAIIMQNANKLTEWAEINIHMNYSVTVISSFQLLGLVQW